MICQRNESMSIDHYQIAWQHATNEIAEIDAQIQRLNRRKEILENLLESLELLVSESGPVAIPAMVSNGLNAEFIASEAPTPVSPALIEDTNLHITRNGQSTSHEDIAGLAYRFWNERGQLHGQHEEDWFRAAHELQNSAY
jgi:hypothetical protein